MFKAGALTVDSLGLTIGKVRRSYTGPIFKKPYVGKTWVYTQLFQFPIHHFLHIKLRLNTSLKANFSTVSTYPTIRTTNLIFNEIVIKSARS
jgi:hypothetical protein